MLDYVWPLAGALLVGLALLYLVLLAFEQISRLRLLSRRASAELRQDEVLIAQATERARKTQAVHGWAGIRKFVVARRAPESTDVCSFYLKPHDGKALPAFAPGQYLTFQLQRPGDTKPLIRCYSLSDAPGLGHYRVSIKRVPAPRDQPGILPGLGSNFFHDHIREGDILDVKAASGHFHLPETETRPLCLLSAGIGLTPVLSMLLHLTTRRDNREIWFFHGVRQGRELVQAETLRRIAREFPNVRLRLCFSDPTPDEQVGRDFDHQGRVSVDLLKTSLPSNNYTYYLCGPGPFMESLVGGLEAWGVPKTDVHFEAFGPSTVKRASAVTTPAIPMKGTALQVAFSRSSLSAAWDDSCATLLDLAEKIGVNISSGCRAGNCGTCLTAIKQGSVDYVQPPGSPPEDGSCLVCIARPKTGLVLDV
jgi:ferredoxin-NADP reductase